MSRGFKRRLSAALSILLGLALFIFILNSINLDNVWKAIISLGTLGALLSFLNVAAMVFGWIWVWKILLNAYGLYPSWALMGRAVLGGYAVSYLTPSMYFGGEPLRIYLLTKELDASTTQVTATVVLWKFLEGLTLVSFVVIGSVNAILSGVLEGGQEVLIGVGNVVLIGGWGVLAWSFLTRRFWASGFCGLLKRKSPWGKERLQRLKRWLYKAEQDIHEAFVQHTTAMIKALVICFLITLTVYIRPWIFFSFSSDIGLTFKQLSFIFALFFFLSTFLWLTPGGVGISELGLIGIFQLVDSTIIPANVVAYSLTIKSIELSFILIGIFFLAHFGAVRLPYIRRSKR